MLAHPVGAACVLFVAVVAQAEATALLLFHLGEALDRASIDGDRRWGGLGRCRSRQGGTRWRDQQKSLGFGLGLGDGILRHQFHLLGQAHGRRKRLRVLNLHGEAQWGQETSREELDMLRLVESPRAR